MRKYTKKELKAMVRNGRAEDITALNHSELMKFRTAHELEKIGYVPGVYGISGGLLKDRNTGKMYVMTERNSGLLAMF